MKEVDAEIFLEVYERFSVNRFLEYSMKNTNSLNSL